MLAQFQFAAIALSYASCGMGYIHVDPDKHVMMSGKQLASLWYRNVRNTAK